MRRAPRPVVLCALIVGLTWTASGSAQEPAPVQLPSADIPGACESWLGPGVTSAICDPAQQVTGFKLTEGSETSSDSADVPGIVQVVGDPLRAGDTLTATLAEGASAQTTLVTLVSHDERLHTVIVRVAPWPHQVTLTVGADGSVSVVADDGREWVEPFPAERVYDLTPPEVPAGLTRKQQAAWTAETYTKAYNTADGELLCSLLVAEARPRVFGYDPKAEKLTGQPLAKYCAQSIAMYIGYSGEGGNRAFKRVTVTKARAVVTGGIARVEMTDKLEFDAGLKDDRRATAYDTIHLIWRDGRWQVAKLGEIFYSALGGYWMPSSTWDAPIANREAGRPAPQKRRLSCTGTQFANVTDKTGDTYTDGRDETKVKVPSLDLRGVQAYGDAKAACVKLSFDAAPRPGTTIDLDLRQFYTEPDTPDGGYYGQDVQVNIGHRGRLTTRYWGVSAGWDRGQLVIRVKGDTHPFQCWALGEVKASSFQSLEPFITKPLPDAMDTIAEPRR